MAADFKKNPAAILIISCPDQKGLIASVTAFILEHKGNILHLEQYVDPSANHFFMRLAWDLNGFSISIDSFKTQFQARIAEKFGMTWQCYDSNERQRLAVFVSKYSHCLFDLLSRYQAGEWQVDLPLIVSNHPDLEGAAKSLGIDFHHFPMNKTNKVEQEKKQLQLLEDYRIDTVVLARYMQILSGGFVGHFPNRIINIHHSFLPAFPGAKPYDSAHERGVKIIGATSHYVTAELDAGPIIEQDVIRVSHSDTVDDLIRKGRDLEKVVLSRAIWHHLNRKILVFKNRTIVFE